MAKVVGVKFKDAGKLYYFSPAKIDVKMGDNVIVETARGLEFGKIVMDVTEVKDSEIVSPLKNIIRIATEKDQKRHRDNLAKKDHAMKLCQEKIDAHHLEMKLIDVEYTFDNSKVVFYFTADGRIDFRELVKDLASVFRMRIELRQIGVRDEAKMIGGVGSCGRGLCCSTWLSDFEPVSIKMAKVQNLSLNKSKISGSLLALSIHPFHTPNSHVIFLFLFIQFNRTFYSFSSFYKTTKIVKITSKIKCIYFID